MRTEEEMAKVQRALRVSKEEIGDLKSSNGSSVSLELLFAPLIEKNMQKLRRYGNGKGGQQQ